MKNATRTLTIILTLTTAIPAATPATQVHNGFGAVHTLAATPEQRALATWAIGRFTEAGLPLTDLTITFHDTEDGCDGNLGLYRTSTRHVDLCNWGQDRTAPENTILHELAHAWISEFVSERGRQEFVDHRRLDNWHHADGAWWQMGQEQAAEIVAWGLMEDPYRSVWLHTEQCANLAEAYEILTGATPLHTSTEFCKS